MKHENIAKVKALLGSSGVKTLMETLGITITELTLDKVVGTMPVDERTKQYYGILHGGASVALAESLASIGSAIHLDLEKENGAGLEINANHLRSVASGLVTGVAKPIHLGKKTHVWSIEIHNEQNQLVCISRCTMAVLAKKP